jgi:regulator of replication initiation timing
MSKKPSPTQIANRLIVEMAKLVNTVGKLSVKNIHLAVENTHLRQENAQLKRLSEQIEHLRKG